MYCRDILESIGKTPLVRINRLCPNPNVAIYAKVEGTNPTGSIKDRIALEMIRQALDEGALRPGMTIIEATSGNTGIGLAMIGAVLHIPVTIVMSAAVSVERQEMIRAFGASVINTAPDEGTDGAIRTLRALVAAEPDKYFTPDQFSNRFNRLTHYHMTAEEIIADAPERITHFVSAVGTSGTIMGVGTRLKELDPSIKIVVASPVRGHYIQGLKNMEEAIVPALYDPSLFDITVDVESEAAFETARQIVRQEGIFVGMSSGAAMLAAIEVAKTVERGAIVCIFPDRGEKYLSTRLFQL